MTFVIKGSDLELVQVWSSDEFRGKSEFTGRVIFGIGMN